MLICCHTCFSTEYTRVIGSFTCSMSFMCLNCYDEDLIVIELVEY